MLYTMHKYRIWCYNSLVQVLQKKKLEFTEPSSVILDRIIQGYSENLKQLDFIYIIYIVFVFIMFWLICYDMQTTKMRMLI